MMQYAFLDEVYKSPVPPRSSKRTHRRGRRSAGDTVETFKAPPGVGEKKRPRRKLDVRSLVRFALKHWPLVLVLAYLLLDAFVTYKIEHMLRKFPR